MSGYGLFTGGLGFVTAPKNSAADHPGGNWRSAKSS